MVDNQNENISELSEPAAAVLITPGSLLKLERERRELSEKVVADQLHITMHYVRSIEADRYDKLPGTVFARGYIKNYALLLGLEPGELIALFDSFIEEKQEARQEVTRRIEARRQKDRNLPWLVFSVIAFILGFAALWAYNSFFVVIDEGSYLSGQQQTNAIATGSDLASAGIADNRQPTPPISPPLIAQSAIPEPEIPEPVNSQLLNPLPLNPLLLNPLLLNPQKDEQVIEVMAAGIDVLMIRFSGESWVEVSDDSGFPPYRDIREAGDILQITGNAPFNVLLGDAPYASMELNGVPVDVANNIRIDNSARLVVGL
ncbi:MAG: RodZ domain-containing protein [Pseudohongiellaceae bacterium]